MIGNSVTGACVEMCGQITCPIESGLPWKVEKEALCVTIHQPTAAVWQARMVA
jgi:hypothetical protein